VRLFTRRGHDWTERYPAVAAAAAKLWASSYTIDGEAVVCGQDGVAVFEALHRRRRASEAILQAFDLLELDGEDLWPLPLGARKAKLAGLLAHSTSGLRPHLAFQDCICIVHHRIDRVRGVAVSALLPCDVKRLVWRLNVELRREIRSPVTVNAVLSNAPRA
jgi:hypothetical protein